MDRVAVRAAYDEQLRRHPGTGDPRESVEHDGGVVRILSGPDGWNGVTWSKLTAAGADAAIAAQCARFAPAEVAWEWKHHSYDAPADLPARLLAAGFAAGPAETLLVAETADIAVAGMAEPPAGVVLLPVTDEAGVRELVQVHDEVFGGDHAAIGRSLLGGLVRRPDTVAAFVARAGSRPVAAGRIEFMPGTDFAGLWGGGTVPEWRGRGVFRALVARRAELAAARGYRYLQVDAAAASRPILVRLGFAQLATTTPFEHPAG